MTSDHASDVVRYAVLGLGHISQAAVLPAFRHASENSCLSALISDDPKKLKALAKRYRVSVTADYDGYAECLRGGEIDAVYIALPNHLHRQYAVAAAEAGVHVLCEKPMALTEAECQDMIRAAEANDVRLMIAYRLHFEEGNLKSIHDIQSGSIGDPKYFISTFSMQATEGIRLHQETGGGTLYDIGIYCINAARYLFRAEPVEVSAQTANTGDKRFADVDEMTTAVLRFPQDRLATFTCSFGAADTSEYRIVGTKGDLRMEPAYSYAQKLTQYLTLDGKTTKKVFAKRDQFAAELIYFSNCLRKGTQPEPSGLEGLADVRIIEALYRSATEARPISMDPVLIQHRPSLRQEIHRPPVKDEPELVHAAPPHR